MNLLVVVSAKLIFFLRSKAANRLGEITAGVLAADHETNLTRWIRWNGGVAVLDSWEDFLAVSLQLGDERQVKPLVLSCGLNVNVVLSVYEANERGRNRLQQKLSAK